MHNKITTNSQQNVPQSLCCLTHKEILMCLSLTLSYKYHDTQPTSFSYSFFASSLFIPDKCGNATVASILLFLKKRQIKKIFNLMKHVKVREFFITPLTSGYWQLWSGAWRFLLPTPFFSSEALSTVQSAERSIFRVILDCSFERKYDIHHIITWSLYEGSTEMRDILKAHHKPL